ncbi:MAG: ATP-binding protein, partial [Ignavibacteriaceae bacterium]|nr:ATP-binding protein [Ignavibacteriaceae bacterium]
DRFFATGVTPVTLDSMTSGFNVAQNITLDHKFHSLTGFTESEVVKLISETMPGVQKYDSAELMNNLRSWYNGSRFSPSAEEKLYNPQMILSFLREFRDTYTYSGMMSDINVTSDWKKIDNIISQLPPGTAESVIDQVLNNDYITDSLTLLYNPETPFTKTDVISLLFYNGLLSIDGITAGFYKYVIPNYLIRQLYWEFFRNRMEREKNLDLSSNTLAPVFIEMAYEGKIGKLIGKISDVMKILSNNDFQNFRESELKMIALAILSVNKIYMIKSEAPAGSGRVDLLLLKNKDFDTKYQYLIELKFVKVKDSSKIPAVAAEAETQALRYLNSEDISNLENLKAYTVVFHNRFEAEVKLIN